MSDGVAADETRGDAELVWNGGVGIPLPVHQRTTIHAGVASQGNGRRHYLTEGGLTDNPTDSLAFDSKRAKSDLSAISVGVTNGIACGRRESNP